MPASDWLVGELHRGPFPRVRRPRVTCRTLHKPPEALLDKDNGAIEDYSPFRIQEGAEQLPTGRFR